MNTKKMRWIILSCSVLTLYLGASYLWGYLPYSKGIKSANVISYRQSKLIDYLSYKTCFIALFDELPYSLEITKSVDAKFWNQLGNVQIYSIHIDGISLRNEGFYNWSSEQEKLLTFSIRDCEIDSFWLQKFDDHSELEKLCVVKSSFNELSLHEMFKFKHLKKVFIEYYDVPDEIISKLKERNIKFFFPEESDWK